MFRHNIFPTLLLLAITIHMGYTQSCAETGSSCTSDDDCCSSNQCVLNDGSKYCDCAQPESECGPGNGGLPCCGGVECWEGNDTCGKPCSTEGGPCGVSGVSCCGAFDCVGGEGEDQFCEPAT